MKNANLSPLLIAPIALFLLVSACAFQVAGVVYEDAAMHNCSIGNHEGPFTEWSVERVERLGENPCGAFKYVDIYKARCKSCNGFIEEIWPVLTEESFE